MTLEISKLNSPAESTNFSSIQNGRKPELDNVALKKAENDKVELSKQIEDNKPIGFKEGVKLFGEGFITKLKGMGQTIVKHPLKTAAIIGGTTALMAVLPLIGISTVAAGSALTLLYAGVAIGKTAYHGAKFVKNNHDKNYSEARQNLKSMGGDSLDLALTMPFVPKAIKNTKDFVKFGKVGINNELVNDIKNSKGLSNKFKALKNGNVKITEDVNFNKAISKYCKTPEDAAEFQAMRKLPAEEFTKQVYDKITKDMGIGDIAPEISMSDKMSSNTLGGFSSQNCSIQFNAERFKNMKQSEMINTIRHELEHYKQYTDIARYKGTDYIAELSARQYLKSGGSPFDALYGNKKFIQTHGEEAFVQEYIKQWKKSNQPAINAYQRAIDNMGIIKEGTPEAFQTEKYIEAAINYPDLTFSFLGAPDSYTNNILEIEARQAGENPAGQIGEYKQLAEEVEKIKVADTFIQDAAAAAIRGEIITD